MFVRIRDLAMPVLFCAAAVIGFGQAARAMETTYYFEATYTGGSFDGLLQFDPATAPSPCYEGGVDSCYWQGVDFTVTSTGTYLFGGGGPTTLSGYYVQATQIGFPDASYIEVSDGGRNFIDLNLPSPATFTDVTVASVSLGTVTEGSDLDPGTGDYVYPTVTLTVSTSAPVPEPATVGLLGLAVAGLAAARQRKRDRTASPV